MYVTYSDLIQIGIFICALVGLCYTIFKGKRTSPPLLRIMTAVDKTVISFIRVSRFFGFPFFYA